MSGKILACLCQVILFGLPISGYAQELIRLHLATTLYDSGLFAQLLSSYEDASGVQKIVVLPVGTGQAIESARRGDADLIITHAPKLEQELVQEGFSDARHPFAISRYILVGPKSDPARISTANRWSEALRMIESAYGVAPFVSRGDNSGTHLKEQELWNVLKVEPAQHLQHYIKSGVGMSAALTIADELEGYLLSEEATFLAQKENLRLVRLFSDESEILKNIYSILIVRPSRTSRVAETAEDFKAWLLAPAAQSIIANYALGVERPYKGVR